MEFLRFARQEIWFLTLGAFGAFLALYGAVSDALEITELMPSWLWLAVGLVIFFIAAIGLIFRQSQRLVSMSEYTSNPEIMAKNICQRDIIADGRRLVAEFNQQVRITHLSEFVKYRPEYPAIRAQLSRKFVSRLESNNMVVMAEGVKDGLVYEFMDELAHLERQWALV